MSAAFAVAKLPQSPSPGIPALAFLPLSSSTPSHTMTTPLSPRPIRSALKHSSTPGSPTQSPPPLPPTSLPTLVPENYAEGLKPSASTPGASGYTTKVSFDTFATTSDSMFSFTLQVRLADLPLASSNLSRFIGQVKSDGYQKTRNTRVYLCAASGDESGKQALEWTLENLVEDGDELVAVRGFESADLSE